MSLPASVSAWLLVLLCAVSGAYCLGRVRRAGGAAAGEAAMGFGMALMAVPLGHGDGWRATALALVFCATALHAVWLLRQGAHHTHHLVGSLTMVYMAVTAGYGAGSGHGGGLPLLTGVLLLYYAGYVVLGGARLITAGATTGAAVHHPAGAGTSVPAGPTGTGPTGTGLTGPTGSAELTRACRLAMGMGMLAMLLAM